jgi:hypothetical protein
MTYRADDKGLFGAALRATGGDRQRALAVLDTWSNQGGYNTNRNGSPIVRDGQSLPWVDTDSMGADALAQRAQRGAQVLSNNSATMLANAQRESANEAQRELNRFAAMSEAPVWNMRDASAASMARTAQAVGTEEWFKTASVPELHAAGYQTLSASDSTASARNSLLATARTIDSIAANPMGAAGYLFGRAVGGRESDAAAMAVVGAVTGDLLTLRAGGMRARADSTGGINPRLLERLDAWRAYQEAGGQYDLQRWVQSTQGAPWGTGFKSGYGAWSSSVDSVHGNSLLSGRTTYLYRMEDAATGDFLKWGITQDMRSRYSGTFMLDKQLFEVASGSRVDMLKLERNLVETQPGPLNLEPWAGSKK